MAESAITHLAVRTACRVSTDSIRNRPHDAPAPWHEAQLNSKMIRSRGRCGPSRTHSTLLRGTVSVIARWSSCIF